MGWMARRPRLFAPGLLYHVIVRGNYKQKTFLFIWSRLRGLSGETGALSERIRRDGLCPLLDVKPCSPPAGHRFRAPLEMHAGVGTIVYAVLQPQAPQRGASLSRPL